MSDSVFELVDATNDEMYFSYGIFSTLEKVLSEINNADPERPLTDDGDDGDYEMLEIRERKLDSFGMNYGVVVAKFERTKDFPFEEDQFKAYWTTEEHSL